MVTSDPEQQGTPYIRPTREFSPSEESTIKAKLEAPIPAEGIAYRSSSGGQVAYIEGWRAFNYANDIFGFNGWSSEILNFTTDFMDEEAGKISVGLSCTVRITLKDGTFHEDIGYGVAENVRSKGAALDKARKEAVTDAIKRALRLFGNHLGNCCYDKDYLRAVKNAPKQPYKAPSALQQNNIATATMQRQVFPPSRSNDIIMTEEDFIAGNDMMDIPSDVSKIQVAPLQPPPQNSFQPNRAQVPTSLNQPQASTAIPARTIASPSRMTTFQPPNWNQQQHQAQPLRQPDFRPFNPENSSTPRSNYPQTAQPSNDFVKWNPSNIQRL